MALNRNPFHLVKDRYTDAIAGSQTSQTTRTVGIPIMAQMTSRSRGDLFLSTRREVRRAVRVAMMPSPTSRQPRMDSACCWISAVMESMLSGFLRNSWMDAVITVFARSALVSRSRNCAIDFAFWTSSADFFCSSP